MSFFKDMFGANQSVPTYNLGQAQDLFKWQQSQARYNVNNGYANMTWDPDTNTQNITYTPQMQGVLGSLFGGTNADKKAEESVYKAFSDKYEPQFERQTNNLQDRLVNQGIPVGSEAYSRAMADQAQTQNEARQQAYYQAQQAGQQARAQEIQNNLGIFNAFNPNNGYQAGAGTPSTDLYGNLYNSQVNQAAANSANKSALAKGIMDGVTTAASFAMLSDARIKENLRPVGQLFNGLTVYAFNFPGEETTRIGLVAQEVQQAVPEAVQETSEGLLAVDYHLATQTQEEQGA